MKLFKWPISWEHAIDTNLSLHLLQLGSIKGSIFAEGFMGSLQVHIKSRIGVGIRVEATEPSVSPGEHTSRCVPTPPLTPCPRSCLAQLGVRTVWPDKFRAVFPEKEFLPNDSLLETNSIKATESSLVARTSRPPWATIRLHDLTCDRLTRKLRFALMET